MSGHNKWSKIKHKKAAGDAAKSKVFGKMSKLITTEARASGGNRESPALRAAIEKARAENMPNDNIERAIKKATEEKGVALEEVLYEAYGPGGVAIIIKGLTDNRNRTASEIKHLLSKNEIELSAPGSALWAFEKNEGDYRAKTLTKLSEKDSESLSKLVEQMEENDDIQEVYTNEEI